MSQREHRAETPRAHSRHREAEAGAERRPRPATSILAVLLIVVSFAGPAWGLWLPWATEEDRVKKTINDIWQALLLNDKATLKKLIGGNAVQPFIDQEMQFIASMKVKKIDCRFKSISVDRAGRQWAFVDFDKASTLADGSTVTTGMRSVLRQLDGEWVLLTGIKSKLRTERELELKTRQESDGDSALPTGRGPLEPADDPSSVEQGGRGR